MQHGDVEGLADFFFLVLDAVFSDVVASGGGPFAGHVHSRRLWFDDGTASGPHIYFSHLVGHGQEAREGGDFSEDVHDAFEFESGLDFFFDVHARRVPVRAFSEFEEASDEEREFVVAAFLNDGFVRIPCHVDGGPFHFERVNKVMAEGSPGTGDDEMKVLVLFRITAFFVVPGIEDTPGEFFGPELFHRLMGGEFDEADDSVHDVVTAFCEGVGTRGDVFEVEGSVREFGAEDTARSREAAVNEALMDDGVEVGFCEFLVGDFCSSGEPVVIP